MKKIIFLFILIILPINTLALTYPQLHYENAIVYDLTDNKILYELNSEEKRAMASLTKLMTIITAIENTEDFNKQITYDKNMKSHVAWYASVVGFKVGEKLTINDLLYGAMLPSGADATVALAIATSGSIDEFVKRMNENAQKIGMTNTNYVNVHGLDEENHYSTAKDIQKLLTYALENEKFKEIYTTKQYTLSTGKIIKSTVQKQSEKYNLDTTKVIGSKTGFTGNAGLCISTLINHQNHDILFITLGAPTTKNIPYNISDTIELINFIENNYNNQILIEKNEIVKTLEVELSKISSYDIKAFEEITLFLENDYNKEDIKIEYNGIERLSYKNKKDEKLGTIKYYYQDEELASEDIYLNTEIKPDYLKIIKAHKRQIIGFCISIIFITIIIGIFKKNNRKRTEVYGRSKKQAKKRTI